MAEDNFLRTPVLLVSLTRYFPALFIVGVYLFWWQWQGVVGALENLTERFSIALTMLFGSFVAGGTALGGGAVAFPVMTKVLGIEPHNAKVFSLGIQSLGMSAASLAILCGRIPCYTTIVLRALPFALSGMAISLLFIAPVFAPLMTKSVFSLLLLCFACTLLWRIWRRAHHIGSNTEIRVRNRPLAAAAFVGGVASGLVGSGADIVLFALLVLGHNADLKRATASSVLLMAATSLAATAINIFVLDAVDKEIGANILAAMPVVVLGAPLGAYVCARMKNAWLLALLLGLISLEVGFTLYEIARIAGLTVS